MHCMEIAAAYVCSVEAAYSPWTRQQQPTKDMSPLLFPLISRYIDGRLGPKHKLRLLLGMMISKIFDIPSLPYPQLEKLSTL